jgi:hypothetical protein
MAIGQLTDEDLHPFTDLPIGPEVSLFLGEVVGWGCGASFFFFFFGGGWVGVLVLPGSKALI